MFGRKSRRIKELEGTLAQEVKGSRETFKSQGRELLELKEKIVGLTADRDGARESVKQINEAREQLRVERDQFAKQVEALEERVKYLMHPPANGEFEPKENTDLDS